MCKTAQGSCWGLQSKLLREVPEFSVLWPFSNKWKSGTAIEPVHVATSTGNGSQQW